MRKALSIILAVGLLMSIAGQVFAEGTGVTDYRRRVLTYTFVKEYARGGSTEDILLSRATMDIDGAFTATTLASDGTITATTNVVIGDAGNIGSASDTDAIAIAADISE